MTPPNTTQAHADLELLTVEELAVLWKVTKDWIYDQVQSGALPVRRLGRQVRFAHADLADYLDQNRSAA